MNKWSSYVLLVIVTLATIGLMMIQVYWIRDAVQLKQAFFVKDVKQAINNVIHDLDKIRIEDRIRRQQKFFEENQSRLQVYDSLNQVMYYNFRNIDSKTDIDKFMYNSKLANKMLSDLTFSYNQKEPVNFYYEKKELISSMISYELKNVGITTAFEYGILSQATNSMIVQKPENFLKNY